MNIIYIPVSVGELIDKITILEIKLENITDEFKLNSVAHEHMLLMNVLQENNISIDDAIMKAYIYELSQCNRIIWDTENELRYWSDKGIFEEEFISAAIRAFKFNYRRYSIKSELNTMFNSEIVEEKQYS